MGSKEQVEEEMKISLSIRIKPLALGEMDSEELKNKANQIWNTIVSLETDKYDYEQRQLDQDYEFKELAERQKLQLRNKAIKKGLDPESFTQKHPPTIHMSSFVQLLAFAVRPCVRPPLVLGEHVDGGGVLLGEGLGVKTLLDGLVPQLQLLPLSQLLELVVLVELSLLVVVLVSLKGDNGVPDLVGFVLQLLRVHLTKGQGLDADGQGDLHLLLNLLL